MTKINYFFILLAVFAFILLNKGCTRDYNRGETFFMKGYSVVRQPLVLSTQTERSFEGIRVAGFDSDILPDYWDERLGTLGQRGTFELFELRYKDLKIYHTDSAEAALTSFLNWCKRREIDLKFKVFWTG